MSSLSDREKDVLGITIWDLAFVRCTEKGKVP